MIDTMNNASLSITVPSLTLNQFISVSVNIPYLDMIYERVSPYITDELLSIGMSIAIYKVIKGSDDKKDEYEDMYVSEFVNRSIELEKETFDRTDADIVTANEYDYYSAIVLDLVSHIEKYFIQDCTPANLPKLEFLIGVMEEREFIDVARHTYDHPSGYLYLFLAA